MYNELYDIMKVIPYRTRDYEHSRKIGSKGKSIHFGIVCKRDQGRKFSKETLIYKNHYKLLYDWGKKYLDSDFEFSNIYLNFNTKANKHKDRGNNGVSAFVYVGEDCQGGELIIYEKEEPDKILSTVKKNEISYFNGSEHYHETKDFSGDRYSIIFYKNGFYSGYKKLTSEKYIYCILGSNIQKIKNILDILKENNKENVLWLIKEKGLKEQIKKPVITYVRKDSKKTIALTDLEYIYEAVVPGFIKLFPLYCD